MDESNNDDGVLDDGSINSGAVSEALRLDATLAVEEFDAICGGSDNRGGSRSKRTQKQKRRRKRRGIDLFSCAAMTRITMALVTLLGISLLDPKKTIPGHSTAFVVISPTATRKFDSNPILDARNCHPIGTTTLDPSTPMLSCSSQFSRDRIRQRRSRRMSLLYSAASNESNDGSPNANSKNTDKNSGPGKSKKKIQNSKNNNNNNNNKKNGNKNTNPNKKFGKGGNKQKKTKTASSSTYRKSKTKKKQELDPSEEKKREIMEQIKAKIREEGEQKKRKEKQQQQQRKQGQKQKPKKTQPKKPSKQDQSKSESTSQARLQNLADEDPPESILDDDDKSSETNEESTRKKLFMNPFEAGKSFRETLNNLSTLGRGLQLPKKTKDKYFLDDRLVDDEESGFGGGNSPGAFFSTSPLLSSNFNSKTANRLLQDYAAAEAVAPTAYIPEVLVVGATGEIGRLVVRRLLLEGSGRFRVRVLVRDLYSQTLNLLGTGVSYAQGDLGNVESLEYALTDVDKIVYVAGAPKPDESDFQQKFRWYLEEHDVRLGSSRGRTNSSRNNSENDNDNDSYQARSFKLDDSEWEQLANVLEVRSELAEQVDFVGMKNLVSAYQNIRHTDYGTSQTAKRSLFKFSKTSGDFDLFALDDGEEGNADDDEDTTEEEEDIDGTVDGSNTSSSYAYENAGYDDNSADNKHEAYPEDYNYEDSYDDYADDHESYDENYGLAPESRSARDSNVVKSQVRWLRNKFDNGVFVGRVPRASTANPVGGEASLVSSRLRAREDPSQGIDMSNFSGFILRVASDGNNYECYARTGLYESDGIEYVYEFPTDSKNPTADNRSRTRYKTIRLAFENFKPVVVRRRKRPRADGEREDYPEDDEFDDDYNDEEEDVLTVPPFVGSDVRYLGFRFRSASNARDEENDDNSSSDSEVRKSLERLSSRRGSDYQGFYMALAYIKVYRAQPEPEFVYLSDARIPPVIRDGMVHHRRKMLLTTDPHRPASDGTGGDATTTGTLFDEKDLQRRSRLERSPEETYFKYRGEEILVKSGLSYTIIRVAGFNELSTSEASTIDLLRVPSKPILPVSRAEVAQVCVSALLDPCALNKCVYMTKKTVASGTNVLDEEDISAKFEGIPTDVFL